MYDLNALKKEKKKKKLSIWLKTLLTDYPAQSLT